MTTVLVAATGGHLKQLHALRPYLWDVEGPWSWATFDSPQSRSMLAHESVDYVDFIGSRQALAAIRQLRRADRILRARGATAVVSTGAGVAVPFFLAGRARGLDCLYIESAARSLSPSLTGKIASAIPGVKLYTQYPAWADAHWQYRRSVFDRFAAGPAGATRLRRVVVSLGTLDFGFERLVRRLLAIMPPHVEVLWQLGSTKGPGGRDFMSERDLSTAMREADAVVAHAGVGSALGALEVGKVPVLVPRRAAEAEHIDDHQAQIATELARRGLAVHAEADALTFAHIEQAMRATVTVAA